MNTQIAAVPNFLEDEDYDTPQAAPVQPAPSRENTRPKQKGTPRARVTEIDARWLAFIGRFPCADTEAISMLNNAQASQFSDGTALTSPATAERRLDKLRKLGVVERFRQPTSGAHCYGLTGLGFSAARDFGYNMDHGRGINQIGYPRVTHYRMVAHVAAQFASPSGVFAQSLGIEPVDLDQLVSEHAMRAAYSPIKDEMNAARKAGLAGDFGKWREEKLTKAAGMATANYLPWSELVEAHPILLNVCHPQQEGEAPAKVTHPDLAVNLDQNRSDRTAANLLIEVELSKKSWEDYDKKLETLSRELRRPYVYHRAIYFGIGSQAENLMRKVDEVGKYGLFENGRLLFFPLTHRDGSPITQNNRITVGGN